MVIIAYSQYDGLKGFRVTDTEGTGYIRVPGINTPPWNDSENGRSAESSTKADFG
jgi:hypothetical protein